LGQRVDELDAGIVTRHVPLQRRYEVGGHSACSAVQTIASMVSSSDLPRAVYRLSNVSKLHSIHSRSSACLTVMSSRSTESSASRRARYAMPPARRCSILFTAPPSDAETGRAHV